MLSFNYRSTTAIAFGSSSANVAVEGNWQVKIIDDGREDGVVDLATVFSNATYRSNGHVAPHFSQLLNQVPCFLSLSRSGAIVCW